MKKSRIGNEQILKNQIKRIVFKRKVTIKAKSEYLLKKKMGIHSTPETYR